jgi:ATP-binding cassette subfamily B multidrug efflux pump
MQHTQAINRHGGLKQRRRGGAGQDAAPGSLLRAIRYLGRYRRVTLVAYSTLFVAAAAQLAVPQLLQNIIDTVVRAFTASRVLALPGQFQTTAVERLGLSLAQLQADRDGAAQAIFWAVAAIAIFAVARGLFSFIQTYMAQTLSQNVAFEFRNELFAKIQRLSFSYHDRNRTGQLMIRATDDVERLRMFIGQGLVLALQALVLLVGSLTILLLTNWKLMLVVLPILPVAMIMFMGFGRLAQPLFMEVQIRLSRLNTILQENLAGLQVVKAFVRERKEQAKFNAAADDVMDQQIQVSRTFSFIFPLVFLIGNLGQAAALYFGGRQIIGGELTLGEWQKFSLYLVYVFFPLGQLGFIISLAAQATASAKRIFEILDARNEVEDRPDAIPLDGVEGRVTFEDVSFRYFSAGEPVLDHVSFTAEPGQTIALLGATGSGKSSIINLIPRFYDASEGRVLVDDHDVRDVKIESLRNRIGIVLQETTLFAGTIRDNIAFGRPDAPMDEIIAAAQAAAAHEFIMEFPDGYDTPVGERGATLSGGQKQRVAIARALLMDPQILIMDDSTSSVDLATEYRIQQALDELMLGRTSPSTPLRTGPSAPLRTSFVIAQRISTVLNADQILVLDEGRIAAQGTHQELMENSPIYAEIYHSQLIGDSDRDLR